ncbi:hypothetical protein [Amycolatopsis viridis]|uniref:Diaminopimelate decarboxylase n=1 Tax=Amycolatopsis viridis TaxID=185678 RepID=A0ABX0T0R8_9PSEU|nr:hypothetical protein [Amycolatopsis viridis]NIH82823.1 diaminopimelate decarboxylase [Amycolatopsis viridis]
MTGRTVSHRRTSNRATRPAFDEAREHGLARRHLRKLIRLAQNNPCRCRGVHRHACSSVDVVHALDSA